MNKLLYILIMSLILTSCDFDEKLTSVYRQKIYNTDKVIYKYTYSGSYDSHRSGTVMLDSTSSFTSKNKNKIQTGLITEIDSNNVIESLNLSLNDDENLEDGYVKTESRNYNDININIKYYQNKSGWNEKHLYYFDKIKESKYHITFYGIERKHGNIKSDTLTIQKGGIWIREKDGIIDYLQFFRLKESKKDNEPKYGSINYEFSPKEKMYVNELSDYGFFKRINLTQENK